MAQVDTGYSTSEISRFLRLPARRIRSLARSGLLRPGRGRRGEYRFRFEDLAVLRTVRELLGAQVPFPRVREALSELRRELPPGRPLAAVRLWAEGGHVVTTDAASPWEPDSRQRRLDFDERASTRGGPRSPDAGGIDGDDIRLRREALEADDWFTLACDLEAVSAEEAREAYRRALEADDRHADTHVNLGRMLHETGDLEAAEAHYRRALEARPGELTALFNLGVVLEDQGRLREAAQAYREAIMGDPSNADAHYNLAGVLEGLGRKAAALRHLKAYRRLEEPHGRPLGPDIDEV